MRNPVRKIFDFFDWDIEADLAEQNSLYEVKGVQAVSKLWIGGFATMSALTGLGMLNSGGDIEIFTETPAGQILEAGAEALIHTPELLAFSLGVLATAEGVRIHRLASRRLSELEDTAP